MPRVLLVEDEESAAEILAALLELEGFQVTRAPNGKRAIQLLEEVQPALVITDYMMPMMDGIEMAKAIRAMPAFASLPIVMTSGVAQSAVKEADSLLSAFLRTLQDARIARNCSTASGHTKFERLIGKVAFRPVTSLCPKFARFSRSR